MSVARGGRMIRGNDVLRFWSKTAPGSGGCIVWTGAKARHGYGKFMTGPNGAQKTNLAHRWIWELATGTPAGAVLMHSCDTPSCVSVQHLQPGTQRMNVRDAYSKGRRSHGDGHPTSKLNSDSVRLIRKMREAGSSRIELATQFGVSASCIDAVVSRRNWDHVK